MMKKFKYATSFFLLITHNRKEKALSRTCHHWGRFALFTGLFVCCILKINSLPADKKATFSAEEIHLMRTTINRLRNEQLEKGQYTDAADDMLLKLF